MDNKTNGIFSIGLIALMMLSILVIVAAPVMAKECSMSVGVQCEQEYYTIDETFVNWGSFYNSETGTINYDMICFWISSSNFCEPKKYTLIIFRNTILINTLSQKLIRDHKSLWISSNNLVFPTINNLFIL